MPSLSPRTQGMVWLISRSDLGPTESSTRGRADGPGRCALGSVCRNTPRDALLQRPTSPHACCTASLGHLGLQGAGQIQVPPDGIVVCASTKCHKEMPDGMGKGDPPVTLEEHHAQAVEDPSGHQLPDALGVGLSARTRVSTGQMSGRQDQNHPAIPPPPQTRRHVDGGAAQSPRRGISTHQCH